MLIEQPAKWLRWMYPSATWRMDKKEHSVYLTFDDGPIPESTPFILETLKEFNIKKQTLQSSIEALFKSELIDKNDDRYFIPDRTFELWVERLV